MENEVTEKNEKKAKKSAKASEPKALVGEGQPYAVIRAGGKQYRVMAGNRVRIEKIEAEPGSKIELKDIVLAGKVGDAGSVKMSTKQSPLSGVVVTAKVVGPVKDKKVIIFKKRRRGGYTKKQGHRQHRTELLVEGISL